MHPEYEEYVWINTFNSTGTPILYKQVPFEGELSMVDEKNVCVSEYDNYLDFEPFEIIYDFTSFQYYIYIGCIENNRDNCTLALVRIGSEIKEEYFPIRLNYSLKYASDGYKRTHRKAFPYFVVCTGNRLYSCVRNIYFFLSPYEDLPNENVSEARYIGIRVIQKDRLFPLNFDAFFRANSILHSPKTTVRNYDLYASYFDVIDTRKLYKLNGTCGNTYRIKTGDRFFYTYRWPESSERFNVIDGKYLEIFKLLMNNYDEEKIKYLSPKYKQFIFSVISSGDLDEKEMAFLKGETDINPYPAYVWIMNDECEYTIREEI